MTLETLFKNDPNIHADTEQTPALVRLRPGVNLDRWLAGYKKPIRDLFTINKRKAGAELLSLGRVSGLPMALAGILAVLAAGALAHALITSIRRRRKELAILKTLGFVGGQVRSAVRWQSLTMTMVALVVGLPVGVVAGRWLWLLFASDIGVVPEALVPAVALAVAPAALLLAVLLASLPARSAARTQPAMVLRTE
jgi:predicted lysophospholipase L1 biosynthesis ABC-type transport system permease subunit